MTPRELVDEILANLDGKGETSTAQYVRGMVALVGPAEALRILGVLS